VTLLLLSPAWIAALIDVRSRRIPNLLTLPTLALALLTAAIANEPGPAFAGATACLSLGVLLVAASRGGFGGGDVKLLTYGGAVVGLAAVPTLLFWMSLAGGVIAAAVLVARRQRHLTIPYGPAIAAGITFALLG
jgi:Flp pilus assembly protein protease CpaA